MKKQIAIVMIATLVALSTGTAALLVNPAAVALGQAPSQCPASFMLHEAHDHDHEGDAPHKHVGTDADLNGDGLICVKHVGKDGKVHVHIDNNLPE